MGGVGKTQTALEYVYTKRSYYDSIFWISGVNQVALLSGFQQIATKIKCADRTNASNPSELIKPVLDWLQRQPISLLVIDNVDDVSIIDGFLPSPDSKCHTLITTRNPNTHGIPAQGIEVDVLDVDVAAHLFCNLLNAQTALNTPEIVSEICDIVNELGLPLAIEQSAAFLQETKRPIHEFLPLYRQNWSVRQKLHKWVPDGNRNYPYSVATTWQMSFNLIQRDADCPAAVMLLQLLAFLNPDLILIEFLQAGSAALGDESLPNMLRDTMELEAALPVLGRFSLIKWVQNGGGI